MRNIRVSALVVFVLLRGLASVSAANTNRIGLALLQVVATSNRTYVTFTATNELNKTVGLCRFSLDNALISAIFATETGKWKIKPTDKTILPVPPREDC